MPPRLPLVPACLAVLVLLAPARGNPAVAPSRADMPGAPHRAPRPVPPGNAVAVVVEISDTDERPLLLVPKSLLGRSKKVAFNLTPLSVGVALALSLAGGGLLLVRGGVGLRRAAMLLAAVGALGVVGVAGAVQPRPVPMPPPPIVLEGTVVDVVAEGDTIRLILPRAKAAELAKMPPPPIQWVAPARPK